MHAPGARLASAGVLSVVHNRPDRHEAQSFWNSRPGPCVSQEERHAAISADTRLVPSTPLSQDLRFGSRHREPNLTRTGASVTPLHLGHLFNNAHLDVTALLHLSLVNVSTKCPTAPMEDRSPVLVAIARTCSRALRSVGRLCG